MQKVSADTITRLTAEAATTPGAGGTPPTREQLIEQVRSEMEARIESLSKSILAAQKNQGKQDKKGAPQTAFKISHSRAMEELNRFERIVANVPHGFRLAPVLYNKVDHQRNAEVYSQFGSFVRPEFIRFLAEKHADELATLGICPEGINRMKKGLDPVDPNGRLYDVNVDHIIERSGGGKVSLNKKVDADMPHGSRETFLANHFSNLILLPTRVHEVKNALNSVQDADKVQPGESKWILMVVPEASPGHSGYVAQPQPQQRLATKNNLGVHHMTSAQLAESTAYQVNNILENGAQTPEEKARQKEVLKPALEDLAKRLIIAFNETSKPHQSLKPFNRFYKAPKFQELRQKISALPPEETVNIRKALETIDEGLTTRFNQYAKKPANDNQAATSKPVNLHQQPHVPHRKKQRGNKRKHRR